MTARLKERLRYLGVCATGFISSALLLSTAALAQLKVQDPLTNPGFVHFYNNEYDEALAFFEGQVKSHPDDAGLYNHVAQSLLYREMLRNGALESQLVTGSNPFLRRQKMEISAVDKAHFQDCINHVIALSQARLKNDPHNEEALYYLGVAHGLRANYLFLVEKAWIDSLREATAARKANQAVLEHDPNFTDARLLLGLDQYVVGSLPFYMRAIGFIGGFHGDREGGIRQLERVANEGTMNRYDAQMLLAVIYRREHRPQQAIPLLQDLATIFPRNHLLRLEQVQMFSDSGDKDSALRVLNDVEALRRKGAPGYANLAPEKIAYVKANLLFWYNDLDPALANLKQVTQKVDDLDLNTAAMAWLRLGQVYDLRGEHDRAVKAYQEIMKAAPNSDIASEAKGYISNPYRRKPSNG